jgi:hypothetical protein
VHEVDNHTSLKSDPAEPVSSDRRDESKADFA